MDFHKDYYGMLGVDRKSTRTEIRAAYRKLVWQYHPDRNQGDLQAEEKMKEINEAYEILTDEVRKYVYDEFLDQQQGQQAKTNKSNSDDETGSDARGRRTSVKKTIIRKERKVYVKGKIRVKYWAKQTEERNSFIMREMFYKVTPTSAEAEILESDIYTGEQSTTVADLFSSIDLFQEPIPQPIRCKIRTQNGEEFFFLNIKDIRIKDPCLTDITKYGDQSLGVLSGEFFGYMERILEEEHTETVTECYGPTGRRETKEEGGTSFERFEYFHSDCSTYWGPWTKVIEPEWATYSHADKGFTTTATQRSFSGCAPLIWALVGLILLIAAPRLFIWVLGIGLLFGVLSLLRLGIFRIAPLLAMLYIGLALFGMFRLSTGRSIDPYPRPNPVSDTIRKIKRDMIIDSSTKKRTGLEDTLITHYLRWMDYDSTLFEATLAISVKDVRASVNNHDQIQLGFYAQSLGPVYRRLEGFDDPGLSRVYAAFDSIRIARGLNERGFASMVVSCVQSMPYFLVLDKSCEADYSEDQFISNYLSQCQTDCCVGNTRFGVRSPLEFLADLKGDCDTRSLFLFCLLKHYDYDVTLLTSEYYRHAILGVSFGGEGLPSGLNLNYNGKNYYFWETTGPGFRPGDFPLQYADISYWNISLIHEKMLQHEVPH